jgi:hypothetical protein
MDKKYLVMTDFTPEEIDQDNKNFYDMIVPAISGMGLSILDSDRYTTDIIGNWYINDIDKIIKKPSGSQQYMRFIFTCDTLRELPPKIDIIKTIETSVLPSASTIIINNNDDGTISIDCRVY